MAAPTITAKGNNKSVEACTANFVFDTTAADDYDSTVKIPANATLLGVVCKAAVALTNGTSFLVKMGPAASGDTLTVKFDLADLNAVGAQMFRTMVAPLDVTTANNGGVISITTTGVFNAGDIDITVFYVV